MDDISVTLVPEKIGNPNAMQISFTQNGQFRSIYVFAEDSQVKPSISPADLLRFTRGDN